MHVTYTLTHTYTHTHKYKMLNGTLNMESSTTVSLHFINGVVDSFDFFYISPRYNVSLAMYCRHFSYCVSLAFVLYSEMEHKQRPRIPQRNAVPWAATATACDALSFRCHFGFKLFYLLFRQNMHRRYGNDGILPFSIANILLLRRIVAAG